MALQAVADEEVQMLVCFTVSGDHADILKM